jgi:hypothetical protein
MVMVPNFLQKSLRKCKGIFQGTKKVVQRTAAPGVPSPGGNNPKKNDDDKPKDVINQKTMISQKTMIKKLIGKPINGII